MKTKDELDLWLKATAWAPSYWESVDAKAKDLGTDYCTGVIDFFWWT